MTPLGSYNGLVISDTPAEGQRFGRLLRRFAHNVSQVTLADATRTVAFRTVHVIMLDAGERTNEFLAVLERFVAQGKQLSVLAVVPAPMLSRVRRPRRLVSDFAVDDAGDIEVLARLRFLTAGREQAEGEAPLVDGALSLDHAQHKIYVDGAALVLAHIEYELLRFFITHSNRTYSRDELLRRVWGSVSDTPSRTVDVHVRRVRVKLGEELGKRLETVRGVGYLWRSTSPN